MRLIRNRIFWVIIASFTAACVLHYVELTGIAGTVYPSLHFGLTRHALDRALFLVPVIHAAFLFKRKGALITSSAALSVMLPRAILISPVPQDAILETVVIFGAGVLASWGIWTRAEEKDKAELALAKLESAHEILQHYAQSAEEDERRQTILNTISTLLGESLEPKRTLGKAIHMVSELMEAEVSLIFSLDEESEELKLVACLPVQGGGMDEKIRRIKENCGWDIQVSDEVKEYPVPSDDDVVLLRMFDPERLILNS